MSNDKPQADKPAKPHRAPADDDNLLDSIGKAISDPVKTGAEEEEFERDNGTGAPGAKRQKGQ